MEIYNNAYTHAEDEMLWELHEIRHKIHESLTGNWWETMNQQSAHLMREWQIQTGTVALD